MFNPTRRFALVLMMAALVFAAPVSSLAGALNLVDYTPAVLAEKKASGEPFLLDFYAGWCPTCVRQSEVLTELQGESSAHAAITIVRVDWDAEERGPLVAELAIPRRSTLVLMQGEAELGRVVAQTGKSEIAALLDLGS